MPNWCGNLLKVTGPTHLVRQFMDDVNRRSDGSDVFSLSALHPCPDSLLQACDSPVASIGYTVFFEDPEQIIDETAGIRLSRLLSDEVIQEAGITTLEGLREHYRAKSTVYELEGMLRKHNLEVHGCVRAVEWKTRNWGTKWDVDVDFTSHTPFNMDTAEVLYQFLSAWSPPLEAIRHLSSMYTSLNFELVFEEEGCDFEGSTSFKDGHVKEEVQQSYTGEILERGYF